MSATIVADGHMKIIPEPTIKVVLSLVQQPETGDGDMHTQGSDNSAFMIPDGKDSMISALSLSGKHGLGDVFRVTLVDLVKAQVPQSLMRPYVLSCDEPFSL